MKVRRAWIREEAGSLAKAVALNWKVISQWSLWVATSLVFIVSCLSLHSKLVKRHLSKQQVFLALDVAGVPTPRSWVERTLYPPIS